MLITNDDLLREETLISTLENKPEEKERRLKQFFPDQEAFDLDIIVDKFKSTSIKAGSIIGFNSGTPIRNRGAVERLSAELTKIAHSYFYDEKDLLRYSQPRNDNERLAVVSDQVRSIADLYEGIQDTKEFIRAKLVYDGRFVYKDDKSELNVEFDLDLPEGAIVERAVYSNPLEVLQLEVEAFQERNGGLNPEYMVMNSKTLAKIKRNSAVRQQLYGDEARLVRDTDLNELVNELGLPPIAVDNDYTTFEGIEEDTVVKHLDDDKIVLHSSNLGATYNGPAKENNYQTGLFVQNIETFDPPAEKTIVGEVVVPVLQNYDGIQIINIVEPEEEPAEKDEEAVVPEA